MNEPKKLILFILKNRGNISYSINLKNCFFTYKYDRKDYISHKDLYHKDCLKNSRTTENPISNVMGVFILRD